MKETKALLLLMLVICGSILDFAEGSRHGPGKIGEAAAAQSQPCKKSIQARKGKSAKIPCYPNTNVKAKYLQKIKAIDPNLQPSYTWRMPESLTPQNTVKDTTPDGDGTLVIPTSLPENSGMLTCTVTVMRDGDLPGNARHKSFEHLLLVTAVPKYSYSALFAYPAPECEGNETVMDMVKKMTDTVGKALCDSKECAGYVNEPYCEDDKLMIPIRGAPQQRKGDVIRSIKKMVAFLKQNAGDIYEASEERQPATNTYICPAGFSIDRKQATCLPCQPGTYSENGERCVSCPVGQFQDIYGSVSCNDCPDGSSLLYTGAAGIEECYSAKPEKPKRPPESCDYWDQKPTFTVTSEDTQQKAVQLKTGLISSLKQKLDDTAPESGLRQGLQARIKEVERERGVLQKRRVSSGLDDITVATLKAQVTTELDMIVKLVRVIKKELSTDSLSLQTKRKIGKAEALLVQLQKQLNRDVVRPSLQKSVEEAVRNSAELRQQAQDEIEQSALSAPSTRPTLGEETVVELKEEIMTILTKLEELENKVKESGLPLTPERDGLLHDIGLSKQRVKSSTVLARLNSGRTRALAVVERSISMLRQATLDRHLQTFAQLQKRAKNNAELVKRTGPSAEISPAGEAVPSHDASAALKQKSSEVATSSNNGPQSPELPPGDHKASELAGIGPVIHEAFENSGDLRDLIDEEMGVVDDGSYNGATISTNSTVHASSKAGAVIGGSVAAAVVVLTLLLAVALFFCNKTKKDKSKELEGEELLGDASSVHSLRARSALSYVPSLADYGAPTRPHGPRMSSVGEEGSHRALGMNQRALNHWSSASQHRASGPNHGR